MKNLIHILKGGPGSGDWGHVGRVGKRGGSGGGGGKGKPRKGRRSRSSLGDEVVITSPSTKRNMKGIITRQNPNIKSRFDVSFENGDVFQFDASEFEKAGDGIKVRPQKSPAKKNDQKPEKSAELPKSLGKTKAPRNSSISSADPNKRRLEGLMDRFPADTRKANANVVRDLVKETGLPASDIERYITSWNGGNMRIALAQESAVRTLGAKPSKYNKLVKDILIGDFADDLENPKFQQNADKITKAIYDKTQKQFEEMGITEVTLFRGINYEDSNAAPNVGQGGTAKLAFNSLESWTTDSTWGREFAGGSAGTGLVLKSTIPVSRIFSMSSSGPGTSSENEMVVIGIGNDNVKISIRDDG